MKIGKLLVVLAVIGCFLGAVSRLEENRRQEGRQQLETLIRRTAVSCYASEGFYPPDIGYMQTHYGLTFDEETYLVHYQWIASNFLPDITVLERSP
jgi:hypothetical protein